jgi:hypothetical protein
VAARPLEAPQPFPAGLQPLVRAITGSARRPFYTTGPATRQALAAAGALGATTGSVVHLPRPPSAEPAALGVVAHELAHLRRPAARPRFLLRSAHTAAGDGGSDAGGAGDDEERAALAMGRRVQSAAASAEPVSAGIVDRLPVTGPNGAGVVEAARRAALAAVEESELARTAAAGPAGQAGEAAPTVAWPAGGVGGGAGPDAAAALQSPQSPQSLAGGPTQQGGAEGPAHGPSAQPGSGGTAAGHVDIDRLAEAIEERVVREIERRGGRYAGVF